MQVGTHRDTKASFSIIRMVAAPGTLGLVLLSGLGLGGCQASGPFAGPTFALDNAQFMATWKTYLHCRSSADPAEIRADLLQLTHVARMASGRNRASFLLLPASLRSFLALPPSRLAVDPHAMAVTCALHGSDVAKGEENPAAGREGGGQGPHGGIRLLPSSPEEARALPGSRGFRCNRLSSMELHSSRGCRDGPGPVGH